MGTLLHNLIITFC